MNAILVSVVTGIFALLPLFATSSRRRKLSMIREETTVLKEMPDGAARLILQKQLATTTKAYVAHVNRRPQLSTVGGWAMLSSWVMIVGGQVGLEYAKRITVARGTLEPAVTGVLDALELLGAGMFLVIMALVVRFLWKELGQRLGAARARVRIVRDRLRARPGLTGRIARWNKPVQELTSTVGQSDA